MLDQAEREYTRSIVDLQAVRLVYRIVIELGTIASIEIVALKKIATATSTSSYPLYSKHLDIHTRHSLRLAMATPQLTLVSYTAYFTLPTWQTQNHT